MRKSTARAKQAEGMGSVCRASNGGANDTMEHGNHCRSVPIGPKVIPINIQKRKRLRSKRHMAASICAMAGTGYTVCCMGLGWAKKRKRPPGAARWYPEFKTPGEKVKVDVKEAPYCFLKGAAGWEAPVPMDSNR